MKREILFRGARVCDGHFVNGSLVEVNGECDSNESVPHIVISYGPDTFDWFEVDPETVGQLWMQIGKLKIFEGDVFEFPKHNVRFVVKYNEKRHQFCIAHPDELGLKYFNPWQCPDESWIEEFMKDAVLIGNIYDNKELLK